MTGAVEKEDLDDLIEVRRRRSAQVALDGQTAPAQSGEQGLGLRGDVAAAQYLYDLVERAFRTETDRFRAGELYADMATARRSATTDLSVSTKAGTARSVLRCSTSRE